VRAQLHARVVLLDWTLAEHALVGYCRDDDEQVAQELEAFARLLDNATSDDDCLRARMHFDHNMTNVNRLVRNYERAKNA